MSTKFRPRTTSRKKPPWCYPGLFPRSKEFIPQGASYLVGLAIWWSTDLLQPQQLTETFNLQWNAGLAGWEGYSAPNGWRLRLFMFAAGPPKTYQVDLEVYYNDSLQDDDSWFDLVIDDINRFDTLQQMHLPAPPLDIQGFRIMA